jgi:hypothetical protein
MSAGSARTGHLPLFQRLRLAASEGKGCDKLHVASGNAQSDQPCVWQGLRHSRAMGSARTSARCSPCEPASVSRSHAAMLPLV